MLTGTGANQFSAFHLLRSGWKAGEPQAFMNSPYNELHAAFSPDGRWLAYQSDESGNFEVYVRPFPGPGGKWQIFRGRGLIPKVVPQR